MHLRDPLLFQFSSDPFLVTQFSSFPVCVCVCMCVYVCMYVDYGSKTINCSDLPASVSRLLVLKECTTTLSKDA